MFQDMSLGYPTWFLLFCVLTGLLWSGILYYRDLRFADKSPALRYGLAALRFVSAALIAFLLLNPLFTSLKEEQKDPLVIFLEDKSASISAGMSAASLSSYGEAFKTQKELIGESYDQITLSFGDQVSEGDIDSFNQKSTNISDALSYVYDNYADQNIGAIVLSSDGIYNEGLNPLYSNATFNAPIFAVGLGDTTVRRDLSIRNVLANKIAYLGDKFNVQIDIAAANAGGANTKLSVEKIDGGQRTNLSSENISIEGQNFFTTRSFVLNADAPGINRYRISVSGIGQEQSTSNNYRDIYVEVIDGREKILIIANAPHPDLAALNDLITNNKNYEVTTKIMGEGNIDIANADLIIYHNLPSRSFDISAYETAASRKGVPRFFIAGAQVDPAKFTAVQEVISINGNTNVNEIIEPSLIGTFDKFTLTDPFKTRLAAYPPLTSIFGNYKLGDVASALFNQKIKKVPTQNPMLAFAEKAGNRTAVLVGEGIWKWRLQDMVDFENTDLSGELINKTLQYLSVKDDKRKFRVNVSKNIFKENEAVYFDAQLYNDAYEMVNNADVQLTLTNDEGKSYEYSFSKTANYYTLNAGVLSPGDYSFVGKTNFGGNSYEAKGRFSVESTQTEFVNLTADHNLLRAVSGKFAGEFVHFSAVDQLNTLIKEKTGGLKPTIYASTSTKPLLNSKWLFALIFLLLSAEWFLRRLSGNY